MRYLDLLGYKVRDKITEDEGIVTSVAFDLYGCIQAVIKVKDKEAAWYDIARLDIISDNRVMPLPDFFGDTKEAILRGEKGPAEKPMARG